MASQSSPQSAHDFTVKWLDRFKLHGVDPAICKIQGSRFGDSGFSCNQFGSQEPGSSEEIVEFACTRFKAEYPIFDKVEVNGNNAAPIYKYLKSSKGGLFGDNIKWIFPSSW
ncbi:glutathione peroxidase [Populus alba x Populus x berolinensis]|nr:glutathione peroxidase [Populus alba x Populus x berolinensis]